MNYLTATLQLLTIYALYRVWQEGRKLNAANNSDVTQEPLSEGSELPEGNELANVKREPKEKSAPPPPAGQLQIDLEEKQTRTYGRTITSLSEQEIRFLLFRMREYGKEKREHLQGIHKRPQVSKVFPLVGSNLKALVSPSIMTDEDYENWKRYGRWAAVMERSDDAVIEQIRKRK